MIRRPLLASTLVMLATVLATNPAGAEDKPFVFRGPKCPLPRSPFAHEKATPVELACRIDADDDGLDDEIEGIVADCFMPEFRFDSAEHNRVDWPVEAGVAAREPRALFGIDPEPPPRPTDPPRG